MKDLLKLIGGLVQIAWALALAVVSVVLWVVRLSLSGIAAVTSIPSRLSGEKPTSSAPAFTMRLGGAKDKQGRPPPPPSLAEYHAAGVNPDLCTLCQKQMPERQREWKYLALDGRPAIMCPRCWGKNVTNATPAEEAAFLARVSTRWWNNPRM